MKKKIKVLMCIIILGTISCVSNKPIAFSEVTAITRSEAQSFIKAIDIINDDTITYQGAIFTKKEKLFALTPEEFKDGFKVSIPDLPNKTSTHKFVNDDDLLGGITGIYHNGSLIYLYYAGVFFSANKGKSKEDILILGRPLYFLVRLSQINISLLETLVKYGLSLPRLHRLDRLKQNFKI